MLLGRDLALALQCFSVVAIIIIAAPPCYTTAPACVANGRECREFSDCCTHGYGRMKQVPNCSAYSCPPALFQCFCDPPAITTTTAATCAYAGYSCQYASDCCGSNLYCNQGTCSYNPPAPAPSCVNAGYSCVYSTDCCGSSLYCNQGTCAYGSAPQPAPSPSNYVPNANCNIYDGPCNQLSDCCYFGNILWNYDGSVQSCNCSSTQMSLGATNNNKQG